MTNDLSTLNLLNIFDPFTKGNILQIVEERLIIMSRRGAPKNTLHLEKAAEQHKKAIETLQSALSGDSSLFFYKMKYFIQRAEKLEWKMTKFHLEKVKQAIEEDRFEEVKRIFYACGYEQYIMMLCFQQPDDNTLFQAQVKELISIHEEMLIEIEKIVKETRLRALFA